MLISKPLSHLGRRKTYGFLVHSTGDGPPKRAQRNRASPFDEADRYYSAVSRRKKGRGPHALIGPLGRTLVYREPNTLTHHVGLSAAHRRDLLAHDWPGRVARQTPLTGDSVASLIASWEDRHPGKRCPGHLYPSKSPNRDYAGIEMTPCGTWVNGRWTWLWGTQPYKGARFSVEQMTALASLLCTWATKEGFQFGWWDTPGRLVGHEDINPITRYGWDPGAHQGWMKWDTLKAMIRTLSS